MKNILMAGITALGLTLCLPFVAQGQNNKEIEDSRKIIEEWVQTRQLISKEHYDWVEQKELIEFRIELFKSEIEDLDDLITEAEEAASEAELKRIELQIQSNSFKAAGSIVDSVAGDYEIRLSELAKQFPEPLLDKIEPLLSKMPKNPRQTGMSSGERMAIVVGVLNEVHKFNGAISLRTTLREMAPDETGEVKTIEVKTLYLGLARAFEVDKNSDYAGVGKPSPEGWQWERRDDLASSISDAIAIYEGIKPPDNFVELPIVIE